MALYSYLQSVGGRMVRAIGLEKKTKIHKRIEELRYTAVETWRWFCRKRSSVYFLLSCAIGSVHLAAAGGERHKVVHIAMFLAKSAEHITFGLGVDGFGGFLPIYFFSSSET